MYLQLSNTRRLMVSKSRICNYIMLCRTGQCGNIYTSSGILTCIHTWSPVDNSLQYVEALSRLRSTYLHSSPIPSQQGSVFLSGAVLIGSIYSLLGRQHAWHAEVKLFELVEWLGMVSASEQTYHASRCKHLQLCWTCHTS